MGTRGLIGHKMGGVLHAVYNALDSYPSCLGREVAAFISDINAGNKWEDLKNALAKVVYVSPDDVRRLIRLNKKKYGELFESRDGMEYYCNIIDCTLEYYPDDSQFLNDSLFCEWAYILNLDENKLEIYKGFQRKRTLVSEIEHIAEDSIEWPGYNRKRKWAYGYAPCKMIRSVPFSEIKKVTKTLMKKLYGRNHE